MTDPSYAKQVIAFTFPHIGNVGANDEDVEAGEAHALGALVQFRESFARAKGGRIAPSERIDLPEGALSERAAKELLARAGLTFPREILVRPGEDAAAAAAEIGCPVVIKISSPDIAHKTEVGGVCLNVRSAAALDEALSRLDAIPLAGSRRYLLEEMAPPGLELIVSARRDDSFGPTVMVGLGGIYAEALRDTATRLAPVSSSAAQEMIEQLRAWALLDGFRGGAKLDHEAVVRCIVALGDLLCRQPAVQELEINPLRVYPSGVLALDALLVVT